MADDGTECGAQTGGDPRKERWRDASYCPDPSTPPAWYQHMPRAISRGPTDELLLARPCSAGTMGGVCLMGGNGGGVGGPNDE
jgi:hypothetical protein